MFGISRTNRLIARRGVLTLFVLSALALAAGCGTDDSEDTSPEFAQVVASETTYGLADVEAVGYKVSKSYDVEGLIGATEAHYGFWQNPTVGGPVDYEVRVYPSHSVAVESGTTQAEEVTGEDALLTSNNSTWSEGLSDRRVIVGGGSRGRSAARYGDYVILGNLIVLCQGRSADQSQERCDDLVTAIRTTGS